MGLTIPAPARWVAALALVLALSTAARAAEPPVPASSGPGPTLVFVIKSDGCECERNLCVAGEQEVVNFLADNPWGFHLERIDLKDTPEAAKDLSIVAVPVVLLVDDQGRRIARFDGFFTEKDFYRAWEADGKRGGQP